MLIIFTDKVLPETRTVVLPDQVETEIRVQTEAYHPVKQCGKYIK